MYGFPRVTDENHSSVGLVKKYINEMLIKYKIICWVVIILILKLQRLIELHVSNWELVKTITVYSIIIIALIKYWNITLFSKANYKTIFHVCFNWNFYILHYG